MNEQALKEQVTEMDERIGEITLMIQDIRDELKKLIIDYPAYKKKIRAIITRLDDISWELFCMGDE